MRPEAEANQKLMAEILLDPSTWTPELADFTSQVFDALSASWVEERSSYRPAPLLDALARADVRSGGRCLEIGSGTGVLTPYLEEAWGELVCADLSMGMLQLSRHSCRIQADAELSLQRGHRVSARDGFLRASNYYRNAYIFLIG